MKEIVTIELDRKEIETIISLNIKNMGYAAKNFNFKFDRTKKVNGVEIVVDKTEVLT